MTTVAAKIGGFYGLHEPDCGASEDSILHRWTKGREFAAFSNARSAFAALVKATCPQHVWLPAYICGTLIAESWRERLRFYHLLPGFVPQRR